ncbi:hypothetical protein F5144DRAFT_180737 [Chaetomium tenue]|uniref:Uncharacterized protein n=1 Tax=Chaetomium tenue TaxID=1854479 RepID=A0ACB7PHE1_9PEZI|nr:hypothetical protein F5144DRAFT_180737 [Chaetomium globosum]
MRPCQTSRFRHFVISASFVWSSHVMCFELWLPWPAARLASIDGIGSAYSGTVLKYGTLLTGGFWFKASVNNFPCSWGMELAPPSLRVLSTLEQHFEDNATKMAAGLPKVTT